VLHIENSFSKIAVGQWKKLIDSVPNASFFQTLECYDFYASFSFLEPFVYAVSQNDEIVALLMGYILADGGKLKRFFSRRAIVNGGILLLENAPDEALTVLLKRLKEDLTRKAIYIEIRNNADYSFYLKTFEKEGFDYKKHLNFQIDLSDKEEAFGRLSKSKQRQIKSAEKNGVFWTETKNERDIDEFYILLEQLYRNKIKRPFFPKEFFQKLAFLPHGKLLVVKKEDRVIGGMACVCFESKVLYEWYVCGDDEKYKKLYPSVMATWAGIEYACQNGIKTFDFMGAGKPDKAYGVREFKAKFGGELVENGRFLCISKPLRYKLGEFALFFMELFSK
jgi:lipid II:glycine glycyltransferase (peptidoglycan interpeptide bridge formation enzyme)